MDAYIVFYSHFCLHRIDNSFLSFSANYQNVLVSSTICLQFKFSNLECYLLSICPTLQIITFTQCMGSIFSIFFCILLVPLTVVLLLFSTPLSHPSIPEMCATLTWTHPHHPSSWLASTEQPRRGEVTVGRTGLGVDDVADVEALHLERQEIMHVVAAVHERLARGEVEVALHLVDLQEAVDVGPAGPGWLPGGAQEEPRLPFYRPSGSSSTEQPIAQRAQHLLVQSPSADSHPPPPARSRNGADKNT